jgi:hypothetical protein
MTLTLSNTQSGFVEAGQIRRLPMSLTAADHLLSVIGTHPTVVTAVLGH